jgi:hypothetical protein
MFNWAWNNGKAPVGGEFIVSLVDPPDEYTTEMVMAKSPLVFTSSTMKASNSGVGKIEFEIADDGLGDYNATYEISTKDTSMDLSVFDAISILSVSVDGKRDSSHMKGNVKIDVSSASGKGIELVKTFLAYNHLSESLVESYFSRMEDFETNLAGDHIEFTGKGVLLASEYDDEIKSKLIITKDKTIANFLERGRYAESVDEGLRLALNFGPRLEVPLERTSLKIILPGELISSEPDPDSNEHPLYWEMTPSQVIILSRGGGGISLLLVIFPLLLIVASLFYWKKRIINK